MPPAQPAMAGALKAANAQLLAGLAAGPEPPSDAAQLEDQISAYRACIESLSAALQQQKGGCDGSDSAALQQQDHAQPQQQAEQVLEQQQPQAQPQQQPQPQPQPQQQQQQQQPRPPDDDGAAAMLPGLGQEGVDFTVGSVDDLDPSEWQVPPHCVPVHANVTTFDWSRLIAAASFDVIMMDPPWQLATANPTRGVALGYSQLTEADIAALPVPELQGGGAGLLFVWVINSKVKFTLDLFEKWGYTLVDEVVWVKATVNRRLAKSHGYYLQHAKEVCLVGRKARSSSDSNSSSSSASGGSSGARASGAGDGSAAGGGGSSSSGDGWPGAGSDVIFAERRGQSQKPTEIYELIEALVPHGRYLEIFARKNNLRNFWVSIGNEVTGTGLPEEDMQAFKQSNCIPGAVYGRGSGGTTTAAAAAAAAGGPPGLAAATGGPER